MSIEKDLKKRTWPSRPTYGAPEYSTDIREGTLINRALRLFQSISKPIPEGECAVTALCCGKNGKIYGATSGKRSHFFYHNASSGVCDTGVLDDAGSVKALAAGNDGLIFGGVYRGKDGYLFSYDTRKDFADEYTISCGSVKKLCVPVNGETVAALALDRHRNVLYGISRPGGIFFAYDITKETVAVKGPLDKDGLFSETLVITPQGRVYGCGNSGTLIEYDPDEDSLKTLRVRIPSLAGRSFYNRLQAAVYNEYDGLVYGSGSADGVLFAFNPEDYSMRTIGKVTPEAGCPALAAGNDGIVYGISGEHEGMAHLFSYNPDTYSLRDIGMPFAASEIYWHGYEFSCACTGANGEIYLGESDRISHLFIYFPAVSKRRKPPES